MIHNICFLVPCNNSNTTVPHVVCDFLDHLWKRILTYNPKIENSIVIIKFAFAHGRLERHLEGSTCVTCLLFINNTHTCVCALHESRIYTILLRGTNEGDE